MRFGRFSFMMTFAVLLFAQPAFSQDASVSNSSGDDSSSGSGSAVSGQATNPQASSAQGTTPAAAPTTTTASDGNYFSNWFKRVDATQAEQPHWITPIATTTPRLEEEFRYDNFWQTNNEGLTTVNYDGNKGLELIPFRRVEIILQIPAYIDHNNPADRNGWGDFAFLIKYRILSGNEKHGNYILTAFLGVSIPTGSYSNGNPDPIITPTIAYGKGLGNFDIQGTFGIALPTGDEHTIGTTTPWNNTFQYRVFKKFWPEVEDNFTHYINGEHDGMYQNFLTPGLVIGRLHLFNRVGLTIGGGFEIATTHFHTNNHNGLFSVRFPF